MGSWHPPGKELGTFVHVHVAPGCIWAEVRCGDTLPLLRDCFSGVRRAHSSRALECPASWAGMTCRASSQACLTVQQWRPSGMNSWLLRGYGIAVQMLDVPAQVPTQLTRRAPAAMPAACCKREFYGPDARLLSTQPGLEGLPLLRVEQL